MGGDSSMQWYRIIEAIEPYASWAFRAALTVTILAFLYIALGIFTKAEVFTGQLRPASTVLIASLILLSASSIFLYFEVAGVGLAIAGLGLGFYFGGPPLVAQLGKSAGVAALVTVLQKSALPLIVMGGLKYLADMVIWLIGLPDRMKQRADIGVGRPAEPAQQRAAKDANMFSPCWKLPFCREVIRKQCPAYLAKKRCWKFGRGCYCDEEMISRIIRGESLDVIKAPTRMSREGKPPCGRCYIYIEHQSHKFRMLSPLALPATIAGMFFGWPFFLQGFKVLDDAMNAVWKALNFSPTNLTPKNLQTTVEGANEVGQMDAAQIAHISHYIFGVLLGFFMLIYISKFIEWAVFKAKL